MDELQLLMMVVMVMLTARVHVFLHILRIILDRLKCVQVCLHFHFTVWLDGLFVFEQEWIILG